MGVDRFDFLVNNAGISSTASFTEGTEDELDAQFAVLPDVYGTGRNGAESPCGGRQSIPTTIRKAPPGLTPTPPDRRLPIILPILRDDMPRPASKRVIAASAGAALLRYSGLIGIATRDWRLPHERCKRRVAFPHFQLTDRTRSSSREIRASPLDCQSAGRPFVRRRFARSARANAVNDTEKYYRHWPHLGEPQWKISTDFVQTIAKIEHLETIGGDDTVTYFPTLSDQSRPMPRPQLGEPDPGRVHTEAPPPSTGLIDVSSSAPRWSGDNGRAPACIRDVKNRDKFSNVNEARPTQGGLIFV
jgi:hypothetical protein